MRKGFPVAPFFLTVLLCGCVETIVMDPHEKDLPVAIHCVLTNPTNEVVIYNPASPVSTMQKQSMSIKYVKGKSSGDYIPVEDASVRIEASDSLKGSEGTIRFIYAGDGKWESEKAVRILNDTKYTLYVDIPGRRTIWAETVCQSQIKPSIHFPEYLRNESMDVAVEYITKHPYSFHGGEDYTTWNNGDNPVWIYAQGYTPEGWKDMEYLVTDHPYADDFNVVGQHFSDLEILGKEDMDDESDGRLRQVFEASRGFMPDLPLHKGSLRISKLEDGAPFFLSAGPVWFLNLKANGSYGMYDEEVDGWEYDMETHERIPIYKKVGRNWNKYFRLCFHLVNSDLDEYLRSVYVKEYKSASYLTALYSTDNTFTNIHGGVGIFGCDFWYYVDFREPLDFMLVN